MFPTMDGLKARLYRNCTRAFRSHRARQADIGVTFERNNLIAEMADLMPHPKGDEPAKNKIRGQLNRVWPDPDERQPANLDELKATWRTDYLEAFSSVVNVPVSRLAHVNYEGEGKVDEASYAALYAQVSGRRISKRQAKPTCSFWPSSRIKSAR